MSDNNPTIFVSQEISSIIDLDQFYEDTDGKDFIISFRSDNNVVTGKLISLKIKDDKARLKILSSSKFFFSFISGSSIENIKISRDGLENPNIEYKNISIISKSVKLDAVDEHEYNLFVKIENM